MGRTEGFHKKVQREMLSSMCTLLRKLGISSIQPIGPMKNFQNTFQQKIEVLHSKAPPKLKISNFHRDCKKQL